MANENPCPGGELRPISSSPPKQKKHDFATSLDNSGECLLLPSARATESFGGEFPLAENLSVSVSRRAARDQSVEHLLSRSGNAFNGEVEDSLVRP